MNKDLIESAVKTAFINAVVAGKAKFLEIGESDCVGFAWIIIRPARGPLVSYLKKHGIGRNQDGGGYSIWMPGRQPTQSISVHEEAAKAFAETIREILGSDLKIDWQSRLD